MLIHSHIPGLEALGTRVPPAVNGVIIRRQKIAWNQTLMMMRTMMMTMMMMMMMMMSMTICFTEATRLLESSGSAVSVPQEEKQQYKMSKERVQCAMKMCNVH